jgi:hypothetical protein
MNSFTLFQPISFNVSRPYLTSSSITSSAGHKGWQPTGPLLKSLLEAIWAVHLDKLAQKAQFCATLGRGPPPCRPPHSALALNRAHPHGHEAHRWRQPGTVRPRRRSRSRRRRRLKRPEEV